MARIHELDTSREEVAKGLSRAFESAHINVLLGSGASCPAIPSAGAVEQEVTALMQANDLLGAQRKLYELLASIQEPTNELLNGSVAPAIARTLDAYQMLLQNIEVLLTERRTTILPRRATIYTTNYDLFIERAARNCHFATLNNGFTKQQPLEERVAYASRSFFLTTFDTGNLYDYRVEIPSINVVKLHGCLSWERDGVHIYRRDAKRACLAAPYTDDEINTFLQSCAIILPQKNKLNTSVLDRTYYELLRQYANEMDKENVLLVVFGFSFQDEHIQHITFQALKNPTLRLVVFAFNSADRDAFANLFANYNNVEIVAPAAGAEIGFTQFNDVIAEALPPVSTWQ